MLDFDAIRNRLTALGFSSGELEFTGKSRIIISSPAGDSSSQAKRVEPAVYLKTSAQSNTANIQTLQANRIVLQAVRNELAKSLTPSELAQAEIKTRIQPSDVPRVQGTSDADWKIEGWSRTLEEPHHLIFTPHHPARMTEPMQIICEIKMPPRTLTVNRICRQAT